MFTTVCTSPPSSSVSTTPTARPLLAAMSATRISALVYAEPPVTLVWAALMFDDTIHWTTYLGIVVVAGGILLARSGQAAKGESNGEQGQPKVSRTQQ